MVAAGAALTPKFDPLRLVPPRYRPGPAAPAVKSPQQRAAENAAGWAALDSFFAPRRKR